MVVGLLVHAPAITAQQGSVAAAAKKEGTLTLYTTIAEKDLPTLVKPFESKYGVKVDRLACGHRQGPAAHRRRGRREAIRRRRDPLRLAGDGGALAREDPARRSRRRSTQDLQPGSVPAHREWAATLLSVWVQVYNTRLVKKDDAAEDLQGPARSEVEGQARHRGEGPGLVRVGRGRDGRRRGRAQVLPRPGGHQRRLGPRWGTRCSTTW